MREWTKTRIGLSQLHLFYYEFFIFQQKNSTFVKNF